MKEIDNQLQWYENNAERKEDDYIKVNLRLINDLYEEIENSNDKLFIKKIIGTFCEIIETQREVIAELAAHIELGSSQSFIGFNSEKALSGESIPNDKQLQAAFASYCLKNGKSSYTANDYCSRIRNLWKVFYSEYQSDMLPEEIKVKEEIISLDNPLMNAFYHLDELHCYIGMKSAAEEGRRNWANTRAAFNKLVDFRLSVL